MNFGNILAMIFKLAIPAVITIETVKGQAISGVDKKTMAQTALAGATQAALSLFPADSQNAAYASAAAQFASAAIDAAVIFTKANGTYQAASTVATGANTATNTTQAIPGSSASASK